MMNSPTYSSDENQTSSGFSQLHTTIQKWIYNQGWEELRSIQEKSIEHVLSADCDIVISAPTASGKTEAFLFPAITHVLANKKEGVDILYISPLKALINDQNRRFQNLCENIDVPLSPWHGDVSSSLKNQLKKKPNGILMITPESLESLLLNNMSWCFHAFNNLSYIVVDEFHAFIGTERGMQLQSLMHRIEFLIGKIIPRIALSATLGEIEKITRYLRPPGGGPCVIIESQKNLSDAKVQLRCYLEKEESDSEHSSSVFDFISNDLYKFLRGKSNLVFANSRNLTEKITSQLTDICNRNHLPNEFFPHHSNLSKQIRENLEGNMQKQQRPATAVCTSTLELGIDIGHVHSIAQVMPPPSISSLRQRLGRSGRRNKPSILRVFIPEKEITKDSHIIDRLRLSTIKTIATINLLIQKKYEPPPDNDYHFSTLLQQTLSVIGQYGGVQAEQLWELLCKTGPFSIINRKLFVIFLKDLGSANLITQATDGQIMIGSKGENLTSHYSFYTAFKTPEEYMLYVNGEIIGSLPISKPLLPGIEIIFAGKRWLVLEIISEQKKILLEPAPAGKPPTFGGDAFSVHDMIRREMLRIFLQQEQPVYLNDQAIHVTKESFQCFHDLKLSQKKGLQTGTTVHIFPWLGDQVVNTLTMLLRKEGLSANCYDGIIDIQNCTLKDYLSTLKKIINLPFPTVTDLASLVNDVIIDKHDHFLSRKLQNLGYGTRFFDIESTKKWIQSQI